MKLYYLQCKQFQFGDSMLLGQVTYVHMCIFLYYTMLYILLYNISSLS